MTRWIAPLITLSMLTALAGMPSRLMARDELTPPNKAEAPSPSDKPQPKKEAAADAKAQGISDTQAAGAGQAVGPSPKTEEAAKPEDASKASTPEAKLGDADKATAPSAKAQEPSKAQAPEAKLGDADQAIAPRVQAEEPSKAPAPAPKLEDASTPPAPRAPSEDSNRTPAMVGKRTEPAQTSHPAKATAKGSAKAPPPPGASADKGKKTQAEELATPASKKETKNEEPASDLPAPLTAAEKRQICQSHEGQFITYYGSVFKVHQCKRYELSTEEIYDQTKRGAKLREVDNLVIRGIDPGGSYQGDFLKAEKITPCKKYDRQYITYAVDVYWVERCIKRVFPDWASYESHRGKLGTGNSKLHFISWQEFASLREGRSMPSVIDDEFRELSEAVDIIPTEDACRGVVGTYVTYFDTIYFIEARAANRPASAPACRKRPVDGEDYTRRHGQRRFHLKELTSTQAVSIPDGVPVKSENEAGKKAGARASKPRAR